MPEDQGTEDQEKSTNNPTSPTNANPVGQPRTDDPNSKRPHWADTVIAIFTVLIFLTYITSDYFLWRQWQVTSGQLEQMKGSSAQTNSLIAATRNLAEAAKSQADSAAAQAGTAALALKLDQRAWITVESGASIMTLGEFLETPVTVTNSGRTPAENVRGNIILTAIRPDEKLDTVYSQGHLQHEIFGGTVLPRIEHKMNIVGVAMPKGEEIGNFKVNQLLIDGVHTGTARIVVYGRIDYSDIYGIPHWLTFCSQTTGTPPRTPLATCTDYNAVDHNR